MNSWENGVWSEIQQRSVIVFPYSEAIVPLMALA